MPVAAGDDAAGGEQPLFLQRSGEIDPGEEGFAVLGTGASGDALEEVVGRARHVLLQLVEVGEYGGIELREWEDEFALDSAFGGVDGIREAGAVVEDRTGEYGGGHDLRTAAKQPGVIGPALAERAVDEEGQLGVVVVEHDGNATASEACASSRAGG